MAAEPQDAPRHAGQVVRRVLLRRNIAVDAETEARAAQQRLDEQAAAHAAELDRLRDAMEARARVLEESRGELRARAERAEQGWTAAQAELAKLQRETTAPAAARRRRSGPQPG